MRKRSVAIMDIRSSEITVAVGEHGVNGTFIVQSKYTAKHEGFSNGQLLDYKNFEAAVKETVTAVLSSQTQKIKMFYVGIPDEFINVVNTDRTINFSASKTVNKSDLNTLTEMSRPKETEDNYFIRSGCQYFVLSDKRRVVNPIGCVTDSLRGLLCFYYCKMSFARCLVNAFKKIPVISKIKFIPMCHAQANYLLQPSVRDGCAILFDFGYISSTVSIVCGNGVAYCRPFSVGLGHIANHVVEAYAEYGGYHIPFDVALDLVKSVNLYTAGGSEKTVDVEYEGTVYSLSNNELKEIVKESLDEICEMIEVCIIGYTSKNLSNKTIYVTGECATSIRGATEHISSRLERAIELATPGLPYYDKPKYGSFFSLLETSLNDEENKTLFTKQEGLTEVKNV